MGGPVWDEARRARAGIADTGQGKRADSPGVPNQVLRLQGLAGNRAVTGLLRDGPADDVGQPGSAGAPLMVQRQEKGPATPSERYEPRQPGDSEPTGQWPGAGVPHQGRRALSNGTLQWSLRPRIGVVDARIEFVPSPAIAGKTIAFVQTVTQADTSPGLLGTGIGSTTAVGNTEVDALPHDRDPFFGAQWNATANKWGDEPKSTQSRPEDRNGGPSAPREGSRPAAGDTKSAVLNDTPQLDKRQSKQFETAAVIVETGQLLCSLTWIIQRWPAGFLGQDTSTIVRSATCNDAPTPGLQTALDRYYSAKQSLGGFSPDKANLPSGHVGVLAPTLARLREVERLTVILGGAATADEPDPPKLSRSRAEAVRDYLVGQGIAASRIQIEAYGSDWARAPSSRPGAAETNRRVEINVVEPG